MALHQAVIERPVLVVARIVLADRPARTRSPARMRRPSFSMRALDHLAAADQDRLRQPLVDARPGPRAARARPRPRHRPRACGRACARSNTGFIEQAGAEDELVQPLAIGRRSRRSAASRRRCPSPPWRPPARSAGSAADRTAWGSGSRGRTPAPRRHRRRRRCRDASAFARSAIALHAGDLHRLVDRAWRRHRARRGR